MAREIITIECTEQQSVPDLEALKRQVKALRKLGFGFAVDDAGAGYASFALVAALRPSIIKIDREITYGISRDDAKYALVEAFFLFSRRIGAKLVAEGIETRADLAKLREIGVDFGQGYLLGKPQPRLDIPAKVAGTATFGIDVRLPGLLYAAAQIWSEEFNVWEMMNVLLVTYVALVGVLVWGMARWERALRIPGYDT